MFKIAVPFLKFSYHNVVGREIKHHLFIQSWDHLEEVLDRYNVEFFNIFNLFLNGEVVLHNQLARIITELENKKEQIEIEV